MLTLLHHIFRRLFGTNCRAEADSLWQLEDDDAVEFRSKRKRRKCR